MKVRRKAILVRVEGHVQGVGFRAWARDEAVRLGLEGWVRNEADGSVSALLDGPRESVERMLEMLRRGPPGASVTHVAPQPAAAGEAGSGFRITR